MYTSDEDLASLGFFGDGFNSLAGDFLLEDEVCKCFAGRQPASYVQLIQSSLRTFMQLSVLPLVVKVFERLVHQQQFSYLPENILHSAHSGFRPGHTTQDLLVQLVEGWRNACAGCVKS